MNNENFYMLIIILIFVAGFATSQVYYSFVDDRPQYLENMTGRYFLDNQHNIQPAPYSDRETIWENPAEGYVKIKLGTLNYSITQVAGTGSMRPSISDNSQLISVVPKSPTDLKVGDIVIFKNQNMTKQPRNDFIVHRIISIYFENSTKYYLTKGDANKYNDYELFNIKVKYEDIVGKVITIIY